MAETTWDYDADPAVESEPAGEACLPLGPAISAIILALGALGLGLWAHFRIGDLDDRVSDPPPSWFQPGAPLWAWDYEREVFECVSACAENGIGPDDTLSRGDVYPVDGE